MRTRDQSRAVHAYQCVQDAFGAEVEREHYKVYVNDLGASILRSGLAVAIARLEHEALSDGPEPKPRVLAARRLLDDLGHASIPDLECDGRVLGDKVREFDVGPYMLTTREMLKVATWFKRAVQATFTECRHADRDR